MNKKTVIGVICAIVVLAIGAGAGFYFSNNGSNGDTTTSTTESTTQTTVVTTESTTESTTASTTVTADANAFLYKGYWYIFDDDKVCSYALKFDKNGEVLISYFNNDNVTGVDAQYYKNGKAKYSISKNVLTVTDIPEECEVKEIELEIKDSKTLTYLKVDAVHKDDLKLDYPFSYFNA